MTFLFIEGLGDFTEAVVGNSGDFGASFPGVFADLVQGELGFEGEEDVPLFLLEIDDRGGHHPAEVFGLRSDFE